jgi:hypothetical protein
MFFLRYYLLVAPNVFCGIALLLAIRKKSFKTLPLFVTLLSFNVLQFLVAFTVPFFYPQAVYKWCVVTGVALSFLIELAVLYELASKLILSHVSLARLFGHVPRWTAALLLLLATFCSALFFHPASERVMTVFETLNFSTNLIAIGLLFVLIVFARFLGIQWHSLPAGVALGLGITASAEMASGPLMSHLGRSGYITVDIIRMSAFHICVLVWLIYILLPEKSRSLSGNNVQISELETQLQELQQIVRR